MMELILFGILISICVLAPWLGSDTSDDTSEEAHPASGWFPPLQPR
jgi:hypothetical protein